MSALSIQPTFPIFTETDGQPLENGYIWIGTANLDPQVNPINVYFDAALTILAPQPIRTLGGYPSNNGTPARLYVNSDYSIRVMNKNGSTVYSAPAATERYSEVVFNSNASQVIYDPAGIGAVATTVQTKLRETVSVKDFGAVGDGIANDTTALTNFFDYIRLNKVQGDCTGTFRVTAPFTLNINATTCHFDANFITDNVSEIGVVINALIAFATGRINITCADALNDTSILDYNARRQEVGAFVTDSGRSILPLIFVTGTTRTGVLVSNNAQGVIPGANSNMFGIEQARTRFTGSAQLFAFTPASITNTGATNSVVQRCVMTFANTLPTSLRENDFVEINDELVVVMGVDYSTNTITAYPQLKDTTLSSAKLFIGAGVEVIGNDANVGGINLVDAVFCGTGVKALSTFGACFGRIHTSLAGVGIMIGRPTNSNTRGGTVGWMYTEGFKWEVVQASLENAILWQVMGGGGSGRELQFINLQPVALSRAGTVRTASLSPDSSPDFDNIFAGRDSILGQVSLARAIPQGNGLNRYLLLAKNIADGGRVFGTIFGKRRGASLGRNSAQLMVSVADYDGGPPAVSISGSFFNVTPSLVTLDFDGDSWVALDSGATGTSSPFEVAYFIGSSNPNSLVWRTAADVTSVVAIKSSATQTLGSHVEVLSTGVVRPTTDNTQNLGSASNRWATVFAGTGTINTSDEREKQDILEFSESEKRVAVRLKSLIKTFRFRNAVEVKGNIARIHVGVIAQEVIAAFASEGLDATRYGILCYDEWGGELDENGNETQPKNSRYGIRYDELFAFIIGSL
jgi:hypothetical protein